MSAISTSLRVIKRLLMKRALLYGGLLVVALMMPQLTPNEYVFRVIIAILIDIPLALGQNLITGFGGLLTLGQAGFYAIGAYTSALLVLRLGAPWPLALLAAGVIACFFGILLGVPCLRVSSDYLTLMTIGFNEIVRMILLHWTELTRGPRGLVGVPPPQIGAFVFNTSTRYYFLYLSLAALSYICMHRIVHSHVGRALIAIREDETAAAAMGINLAYYKVLAFAFGTFWAGIAGSMLAHFLMFVSPATFTIDESLLHMQMAILGGLGSLPGSVLGAAILVGAPQVFQPLFRYRMLLNGILMVALMVWRPQGILGTSAAAAATRRHLGQLLTRTPAGKGEVSNALQETSQTTSDAH
jgi:branched-chain amino acid transport system permease protein